MAAYWLKEGVEVCWFKILALRAFEDCMAAVFVKGWPEVAVAKLEFEVVTAKVAIVLVVLEGECEAF